MSSPDRSTKKHATLASPMQPVTLAGSPGRALRGMRRHATMGVLQRDEKFACERSDVEESRGIDVSRDSAARRNASPDACDSAANFSSPPQRKKQRRRTYAAPGHLVRRALGRLGTTPVKKIADGESDNNQDASEDREEKNPNVLSPEQRKRLRALYERPSVLAVRQLPRAHGAAALPGLLIPGEDGKDSLETDTGMVRMVYHKVRDIRQPEHFDGARRRNSFQDLGEDFRHSVRVCAKARDFVDLAIDGVYKKVGDAAYADETPAFQVNQSVARNTAWNELLDFMNTATVKTSAAGTENCFGPKRTVSNKCAKSPKWQIQKTSEDSSPKKKPFMSGVRSLLNF